MHSGQHIDMPAPLKEQLRHHGATYYGHITYHSCLGASHHRDVTNTGSHRGSDEVSITRVAPVTDDARRKQEEVTYVDSPGINVLVSVGDGLCSELLWYESAPGARHAMWRLITILAGACS